MPDKVVVRLPIEFRRHRKITPREIWASSEPPSEMVWEVCPYTRNCEPCQGCPQWEEDEQHGKLQRGCYGTAAEACRVVEAMQRRATPSDT